MQSLTSPWKSKNQLHASTIQWHRISILIPKKKDWWAQWENTEPKQDKNQHDTYQVLQLHVQVFSFKGFGWLPLQHRCLQHRWDSAVCSLCGGWLRALVPHHSTSHWPLHGLLAETPSLPMLLGLLKPRRKEESRNLSFFHASKASTMWKIPQN